MADFYDSDEDDDETKVPYESDESDDDEYIAPPIIEKEEPEESIDSDEDEEPDDLRFRKMSRDMKLNILQEHHTELQFRSSEEVQQMTHIIRNTKGQIIDPLHRTIPIMTKYEKARILGERARQLEEGGQPFITIPTEVIDSYVIAEMELKEKVIPFIIERPLPNGGCEYWQIGDLEIL
jgi:DNA-directed RNA polymerase subunit K/omega